MTAPYPRRHLGRLTPWTAMDLETQQHLAGQVPARLQRVMYGTDEDIPSSLFAHHLAAADRRLARMLETDEEAARLYFTGRTFAAVLDADPMRAAEAEYYLCDALIEHANRPGATGAEGPLAHPLMQHPRS